MKVLVLGERFPPQALDGLDVVDEPADDVAAILTTPRAPVGAELIGRLPALRIVATASVGFDHVDVEAAQARGIVVRSVPDYCTEEVADHTLALLFALLRGIVALDRSVAAGGWDAKAAGPLRTLGGLRVGIVGHGRIGGAVSSRVRTLGAEVWANDVVESRCDGVRAAPLAELLRACDAVTLHVPLTAQTRGLVGARALALMRPDALLVNTSRGAVVDLDAVVAALREGRLGGAALDVLPAEPPTVPPSAPNLIVTPHAAYYSEAAQQRAVAAAVAAVREALTVPGTATET
ncbi:MAG TPA: C-terminal binding protein [Gaiellaceae bacterium]